MNQRRNFLKTAGGGMLVLKPETVFGTQANSAVEVGIVGCGGRGNWIGPFFPEYAGARIVALADVQKANLDSTAGKLQVDSGRLYHGPDAYKQLAASKVDAVVIETPTLYHPEVAEEAVNAGKHVFMAKPVAVDVPGCRTVLSAGRKAMQKHLTYWVDFQTRSREVYQEAAQRIHRGDVGRPAFAQVLYYAGRPWRDKGQPGMDPGHRRMANWFGDRVLSGDIIVEQNIHVIDVANWFLQSHPIKAHGAGGRTDWSGTPNDTGDAWDHFAITFTYPNGVHASFSSHQLNGAFSDLCVRVTGIDGTADTHYGGLIRITGKNAWMGAEKDDTFKGGAVENVKKFIAAIRDNKPIYNFETSVESNLTGILGRTAAYRNAEVSWDDMMKSNEKWTADLKLKW
ncbi:MAG: Gfo/Idh/MocA family oxidoreductase [Candidatus Solibacter usitatus]|nr:Gfo/Idh/MocA family oxidoreductase [Candidatus Solibacter usitatus]